MSLPCFNVLAYAGLSCLEKHSRGRERFEKTCLLSPPLVYLFYILLPFLLRAFFCFFCRSSLCPNLYTSFHRFFLIVFATLYFSLHSIKVLFEDAAVACSQARTRKPNYLIFHSDIDSIFTLLFPWASLFIISNWICQAIRPHLILHPAGRDYSSTSRASHQRNLSEVSSCL